MMFHWQGNDIKLRHIESRTTQKGEDDLDFFVECGGVNGSVKTILNELNEKECIAKALGSSLVKEPEEGKIFLLNWILTSRVVYIWQKQPQKYHNGKIKVIIIYFANLINLLSNTGVTIPKSKSDPVYFHTYKSAKQSLQNYSKHKRLHNVSHSLQSHHIRVMSS